MKRTIKRVCLWPGDNKDCQAQSTDLIDDGIERKKNKGKVLYVHCVRFINDNQAGKDVKQQSRERDDGDDNDETREGRKKSSYDKREMETGSREKTNNKHVYHILIITQGGTTKMKPWII